MIVRLVAAALGLLAAVASPAEPVRLTLLHVNDTHGQLLGAPDEKNAGLPVGGMARLATLVSGVRAENPGGVALLHAGDVISRGAPVTVWTVGRADFAAMDLLGFDAMTPGNGDYYTGVDHLLARACEVRFPMLAANVTRRSTGEALFPPFVILRRAGLRVAVLGLTTARLDHPSGRDLRLADAVAVARQYGALLRRQADVVVALSHLGHPKDLLIAAQAPEFDAILGGHTHTRLERAVAVPRPAGGQVYVAQAGDLGRWLGRLDLTVGHDAGGTTAVLAGEWRLLPVDAATTEAANVAELLAREQAALGEVVATLPAPVAHSPAGPSPMIALMLAAMRTATGAPVALIDRGAAQAGLAAGPVTIGDICRAHPWNNELARVRLTPAQLNAAAANGELALAGWPADSAPADGIDVIAGIYALSLCPLTRDAPTSDTGLRLGPVLADHLRRRPRP